MLRAASFLWPPGAHRIHRRLVCCLLLLAFAPISLRALADTIHVAPEAVEVNPGDGVCSLREAIDNANADADTSSGDCAPGSGPDVLELAAGSL